MRLIYVAGPFRAENAWLVEKNIRAAEEVGFKIAELGGVPVIPHTLYRYFDGTLGDEFWLEATSKLLLKCDGIMLLEGWGGSTGSMAERKLAKEHGIKVWFWYQLQTLDFYDWLKHGD